MKNIDIDINIDKTILKNIDKEILENIYIDINKEIWENIDKIANGLEFGISNKANLNPIPIYSKYMRMIVYFARYFPKKDIFYIGVL